MAPFRARAYSSSSFFYPPHSSSSPSSSSSKGGTGAFAASNVALMELRQRIFADFNRLSDRDTHPMAAEDLTRIAETLAPEALPACLSCLHDTASGTQQKAVVRRECARMFATLASVHEDLLSPHLPKIVNTVVKRLLRDADAGVRDACADAMGILAAHVTPPSSSASSAPALDLGPLTVFLKPLFDILSEQNKPVQAGAATCLARVIENTKETHLLALQRVSPRIIKHLNSRNFGAKAALLSVVASIVQATSSLSYQCMSSLISCVQASLKSSDWATRKAASEVLANIAVSASSSPASFKISTLDALEQCRFDKVKPVRDTVIQTMQIWKSISDPEPEAVQMPERMAPAKENTFSGGPERTLPLQNEKTINANGEVASVPKKAMHPDDQLCSYYGHTTSTGNKINGSLDKKRPVLSAKNSNHDVCQSMKNGDYCNGVTFSEVPSFNTSKKLTNHGEGNDADSKKTHHDILLGLDKHSHDRSLCALTNLETDDAVNHNHGKLSRGVTDERLQNLGLLIDNRVFREHVKVEKKNSASSGLLKMDGILNPTPHLHGQEKPASWDGGSGLNSLSNTANSVNSQASGNGQDLSSIKRQLYKIELQQTSLLELLEDFMRCSQRSLHCLETRLGGVEDVIDHLAQDLSGKYENMSGRGSGKSRGGTEIPGLSKLWKKNDNHSSFQDRLILSEAPLASGGEFSVKSINVCADVIDEHMCSGSECSESKANSRSVHIDFSSELWQKAKSERGEGYLQGSSRFGGNGTQRDAWCPLKEDVQSSCESIEAKRDFLKQKAEGQGHGSSFWSLWARAVEFLQSGDAESAYRDALCAGDEILLIRLMRRTGPILAMLSSGTVIELLRFILGLLLRKSFLDIIVPWIQQMVDLVRSAGPESMAFPLDFKREFLVSLQEASTLEYPELWIGKAIAEVAIQLAKRWGMIIQRS